MALTLSQAGIETSNTVEAWHVTQSIDAFTGTEAYDIVLSGSLEITGSINAEGLSHELRSTSTITITGSGVTLAGDNIVIDSANVEITDNGSSNLIYLRSTLTDSSTLGIAAGTEIDFSQAGNSANGFLRIPTYQTTTGAPKSGMMYWDDAASLLYIYSETNNTWMSASFS